MAELTRMSVSIDSDLLAEFDRAIAQEGLPSRSEAVTRLVREFLISRNWQMDTEVAGTITLLYDHHSQRLTQEVMGIQHDFTDVVIATQHVHLNHSDCLEIITVRGKAGRLRELYRNLCAVKGLVHHALTMTSSACRESEPHDHHHCE